MEEANDVQALEKISSEVDESQIKVILSSQCIKAQAFLLDKLKKQTERHKETCSFISSANLKVETEIKQAEQEIRSMLIAQETIKSANVDIKKDLLLAKHRKADIIDRVTEGKNKYEALWLQCKTRYESIPFVKKLLQATERQKATDLDIDNLDKEIGQLYDDLETQRKICDDLDKKRCIELANFMVNELPNTINIIKGKVKSMKDLTEEIEQLLKEQNVEAVDVIAEITESLNSNAIENTKDDKSVKTDDLNATKFEDDPLIPKLNLVNFDLDIMDVNLDQVKMKKDELNAISTTTESIMHNFEKNIEQRLENEKSYDYMISPYFKPFNKEKSRNFSNRKLINILEDINVNNSQVYDIVKNVDPEQLKPVDAISVAESVTTENCLSAKDKNDKPIVSENIEEIDLTSRSPDNNIIIPPTQFLDISLSDDIPRKRVSFDLPSSMQINEIIDDEKQGEDEVNESVNETMTSQLDVSAASDESFKKIKEMLLKKHNLDLSPQFVYAKNNILQKKEENNIVTSKFFQTRAEPTADEHIEGAMEVDEQAKVIEIDDTLKSQQDVEERQSQSQKEDIQNNLFPMDVDDVVASSPRPNKDLQTCHEPNSERPIAGLLFTHGTQAIPDSLNVSLSTTGYEDSDFPHCIDSSLLLSPKADIPASNADNHEVLSQEVPNFLSGFRKTGLSFFGGPSTSSEPKVDSSVQNDGNNFNFNFGGEKKTRGGLFSLFR